MRLQFAFPVLLQTLVSLVLAQEKWPIHDNGLNKVVQWDRYSYIINGQRLFVWSGEMHYWRAPVPEIWIDILEKVKAAGFNTISFYGSWAYHSAAEGHLDFESGAHNFEKVFELAKEVGLYVLFRPGPYINAEHTAGGFPGWVTTGDYGRLRDNETAYTNAWTPYMSKISQIIAKHQVTNGGNVFIYQVENEYGQQWRNVAQRIPNYEAIDYMEKLQANVRANGIDVPLIANDPNMRTKSWSKDFSDEGGNVDNFGFDHYPSCWSCNLSECASTNNNVPEFTVFDYYTNFQEVAPTQPSFLMEFQGGSYLPWAGPRGGCVNNTGADWVNVYYRHNIGQKVSAMNVYMVFGGTSGIPYPNVGTSYDYSAPISETRFIGAKYSETKLFGHFVRVARDLTKVERVGNSSSYASTPSIFTDELRNVDFHSGFYVVIHTDSTSSASTAFKLNVATSEGNFTIPRQGGDIILNGRQSKILVTDFKVGKEKLIYSTSEILTVSVQDSKPVTVFWLPAGESGEIFLTGVRLGFLLKGDGCSKVKFKLVSLVKGGVVLSYAQGVGSCVVKFENGHRFVLVDRSAAYKTWVPSLSVDPFTPENSTVIVQGPYLVRRVAANKKTLEFKGDWSDDTGIEVFASSSFNRILFNGKEIPTKRSWYGSLIGKTKQSAHTIASVKDKLPKLDSWKVNDSLPERKADYDDSKWVVANKNSTKNALPPATYPVLYASDYGYHMGNILWRGRFDGKNTTGVHISVIGGTSHGWSAYLNGQFLKSSPGATTLTRSDLTITFPTNATLLQATNNTLLIIQDHMGKDQTSGTTNPRGIYNATLLPTGTFTSWKVQGRAGGEQNIDPVRGALNEGGLYAERLGWHLPGFNDGAWESGTPGAKTDGVNFFRKVVALDLPRGVDVSLGFVLGCTEGKKLRVQLYVNGYMFGKYIPHIGNQIVFPVFPGILDYHGENTIGLSVWNMEDSVAEVTVDWTVMGVAESSFDPGFEADYLRPKWADRSEYS